MLCLFSHMMLRLEFLCSLCHPSTHSIWCSHRMVNSSCSLIQQWIGYKLSIRIEALSLHFTTLPLIQQHIQVYPRRDWDDTLSFLMSTCSMALISSVIFDLLIFVYFRKNSMIAILVSQGGIGMTTSSFRACFWSIASVYCGILYHEYLLLHFKQYIF